MRIEEKPTVEPAHPTATPTAKLPGTHSEYRLWQRDSNDTEAAAYIDLFGSFVDSDCPDSCLYATHDNPTKCEEIARQHHQNGLNAYRAGDWSDAMAELNKSLQHIEHTADDRLAAVYLHRSKCFQAMRMYDKAAADLKLAEQRGPADRTIDALRAKYRKEAAAHAEASAQDGRHGGRLALVSDARYTGLANCLAIRRDGRFGRHLVAERDIAVGQPIVNERVLFFASAANESRCSNCFKRHQNFVACGRCAGAVFCGRRCRQQDRVHRLTCRSRFNAIWLQLKLQVHSILMAVSMFDGVDDLCRWIEAVRTESDDQLPAHVFDAQSKYRFYLKLAHRPEFSEDLRFVGWCIYKCVLDMPKMALLFGTMEKRRFLQHLIGFHCQINATNGFSDGDNRWISVITSMLNHSCAPNVLWTNYSDRSVCIAIRPIKCGEQLFISYVGNVEQPKQLRQQQLFDDWQFWCRCDRCEPRGTRAIRMDLLTDEHFKRIARERLHVFQDDRKRMALEEMCVRCLTRYGSGSWSYELGMVISLYMAILLHELLAPRSNSLLNF